jgi:hypothetical protein
MLSQGDHVEGGTDQSWIPGGGRSSTDYWVARRPCSQPPTALDTTGAPPRRASVSLLCDDVEGRAGGGIRWRRRSGGPCGRRVIGGCFAAARARRKVARFQCCQLRREFIHAALLGLQPPCEQHHCGYAPHAHSGAHSVQRPAQENEHRTCENCTYGIL